MLNEQEILEWLPKFEQKILGYSAYWSRRTEGVADPDDLANIGRIKAWECLQMWQPGQGKSLINYVRRYVWLTICDEAYREVRARSHEVQPPQFADGEEMDLTWCIDTQVQQHEDQEMGRRLFDRLKEIARPVVYESVFRRYVLCEPLADIARDHEVTGEAVRFWISQGLKQLRGEFVIEKDSKKEFSVNQIARLLGVHKTTVVKWSKQFVAPSRVTPGGHRRFSIANLVDLQKMKRTMTLSNRSFNSPTCRVRVPA